MPEVRLDNVLNFIFEVFADTFQVCINILTSFKIGEFTLFSLLIIVILLSFLIPLIITIPQNMNNRSVRAKAIATKGSKIK